MKEKKSVEVSIIVLLIIVVLISTTQCKYDKEIIVDDSEELTSKIRVAFSQAESVSPWVTDMVDGFKQATKAKGMELIYDEPEETTSEWQIQNLKKLLDMDVDYLVIFPREEEVITSIMKEANSKGVSVIAISSKEDLVEGCAAVIFTDYEMEGRICAQILAEKFAGKSCNLIEITGPEESIISTERLRGFREEIVKYPNIKTIASGRGNSERLTAQQAMEDIIIEESGGKIDAIFACSDEDGLGALQALKLAGYDPGKEVSIVSINGIQDTLKAIVANEYEATVRSSTHMGYVSIEIITRLEKDLIGANYVVMPHQVFNRNNVTIALASLYEIPSYEQMRSVDLQ